MSEHRRVRIVYGDKAGRKGYATVPEDDPGNDLPRLHRNRHKGLWVTLDPEPSVTFGDAGMVAARPLVVWVPRFSLHVMTPLEEMGDLTELCELDGLCSCGHPRKVHFAGRCLMPRADCSCCQFKEES